MGIKEDRVLVADANERLLKLLGAGIKAFSLYPPQHPMATEALHRLLGSLRSYMDACGPFVARIVRHSFAVDGVTYEDEGHSNLALYLYVRKLAVLTILRAATDQEIASFLSIAGMDRASLEAAGGIEHLLWQSAVGNVQVIELTLDQEQEVEALGLNAFLALIGRGRLAPREREAVLDILDAADQAARLLHNVYLMSAEVFAGISQEEQFQHAYQAVKTLDRLILDEPLEAQPHLYANLTEAPIRAEEPLRSALVRALISRAGADAPAKILLHQCSAERLAEMIVLALPGEEIAGQVAALLRVLSLPEGKADALLSLLGARLRPPGAPPTWLSDAVRPGLQGAMGGREPEVPPEFVIHDGLIVINREELEQRIREAKAIDEAASTREVIRTLVDVLRDETDDEEELLDVAEALGAHLLWMVQQQEFALLAAMLEALTRVAAAGDHTRSTLAAGLIKRVTEHPLLDGLLAALWAGRDTRVEPEVRACLEVLAGKVVTPLVRVLGGEPRAGMRAILCDLLVGIGHDHAEELGSFIGDERWYLVRNIANILGRLQHPQVATYLRRVLDHPEYRVRREVADALARLGTEEAQALLVRLLDDSDQRIQLRAVQALNAWGTRRALPKILGLVVARDPTDRLVALKAAALEALERLGAPEALPVLKRLAHARLVFRRRSRDLRALARRAVVAIEGQAG
ncbi:MAG: HEAT repeat domain-containing protein, partial [Armatimonadetes bacterium]|nr:HEAT repeat domain-containing protein [Armatimonadota bacterium]